MEVLDTQFTKFLNSKNNTLGFFDIIKYLISCFCIAFVVGFCICVIEDYNACHHTVMKAH